MYTVGKDPKRTNTSGSELTGDKQQHLGKKVLGLCYSPRGVASSQMHLNLHPARMLSMSRKNPSQTPSKPHLNDQSSYPRGADVKKGSP